jgi:hypothetical protein
LARYLERSSEISRGSVGNNGTRKDVHNIIKDMAKNGLDSCFYDGINVQDIDEKQAEIKNTAKTYGMKAKINYASDSRFLQETLETPAEKAAAVVPVPLYAGFLWGVQAAVGVSSEKAAAVVATYMAGVAVQLGVAYASRARSDGEKAKFDDYAELRHAQFALKQLKREIVKRQKTKNEGKCPTLSMLISKQAQVR